MQMRQALKNGPLGFGAAPLGNMFRNIPDDEARATVDTAWEQGTRYFDTAPFYGAGLSEIRLGAALDRHKRDDWVLSTKVGRLILDETDTSARDFGEKGDIFRHGRPNKVVYDYTADGTRRSIEDSLERMRAGHIDFVWVHDIAQDFHGDGWLGMFDIARKGAFVALDRLRDEGVIKGWGLGVNKVEPVEALLSLAEAKPDATLLAGRYSLLDHDRALQRLMPAAAAQGVDIVVGGPYSSGVLVGGSHFEYGPVPPAIAAKVAAIETLCAGYHVPIKAAGLQFCLAHPAVAAVIPGASKPERLAEDHAALTAPIPAAFWEALRAERLVGPSATLPVDREARGRTSASATSSLEVAMPAEHVWGMIGGFGSLPDWLPDIRTSTLGEGGRVRHITNRDGVAIVERLMSFDESGRSYTYRIVEAPFPVTDYQATLKVHETGHASARVEWSGRFAPKGASDGEAETIFQRIFDEGLKALATKLAG